MTDEDQAAGRTGRRKGAGGSAAGDAAAGGWRGGLAWIMAAGMYVFPLLHALLGIRKCSAPYTGPAQEPGSGNSERPASANEPGGDQPMDDQDKNRNREQPEEQGADSAPDKPVVRDVSTTPSLSATPPGPDWTRPLPHSPPRPTYWPLVLAFGLYLLLLGFMTMLFITWVGLLLIILSVHGWIGELRYEQRQRQADDE